MAEVRAATQLRPSNALVSLDIRNAFGSVRWADALRAVLAKAPKLAPLLAIQWYTLRLTLYLQAANGVEWHALVIYGSLLQGGLDGRPVFCIVIGIVMSQVSLDGRVSPWWSEVLLWIYVDDIVLQ